MQPGRVRKITSPNGYPSAHEYDGAGRLTKWTDPEGYVWRYDYDAVGNITNITDALAATTSWPTARATSALLERNQDNFEWHYDYDELLA